MGFDLAQWNTALQRLREAAETISSTNCAPYRVSFAWPTPTIVENSSRVLGWRCAMSRRLASLKMM